MNPTIISILLLICSNVFMTFAWYAHLKELNNKPWIVAALVSWGIALFEYLLQVPANRIGHTVMSVGQLKILQEVITISVFVPFAYFYLKEPLKLDYLWAGLCMLGAVFFMFRDNLFRLNQEQIFCNCLFTDTSRSCKFLLVKNKLVSSANIITSQSCMALTRSLIYTINSRGPNIEP